MTANVGFVGVVRMANHFAAMHIKEKGYSPISQKLTDDIKVAQATAAAFAEKNHLPFDRNMLYQGDRPIYTVIKKGEKWYPAEIYPDHITLLTHFGFNGEKTKDSEIGNKDLEQAKVIAHAVADVHHSDFMPEIGISMERINGNKPV